MSSAPPGHVVGYPPPATPYRPPAVRSRAEPVVPAVVGSLHDILNLDLDLGGNVGGETTFVAPGGNTYAYVLDEKDRGDVYKHHYGRLQRCRLRNIQRCGNISHSTYREAMHQYMCRIDLQNGWVHVSVHGRDRYDRLLIDLFDPVTGEDLGAWLIRTTGVVRPFAGPPGQVAPSVP